MSGVDYPRALLAALAAVVLVALLFAASTSATSFGPYNPRWNGAGGLVAQADAVGADATVVRDVEAYDGAPPSGTVAVVLSPAERYGEADVARLRRFVRRGGTLVVAEDYGDHADALLAGVGADARIDGVPLRDERFNYRSPAFPVATGVADHPLVAGVDRVTLNHGTAVEPNGATVLVRTSSYTYRDVDGDGSLDDAETLAARPVATVEPVGEGRVVVVGDPSVAINAMLERPGNRAFVRSLFAGHERVLLDYSHAAALPPLAAAVVALRGSAALQVLVAVLLAAALAAWARGTTPMAALASIAGRRRRDPLPAADGVDEDALVEYLARARPAWSRERVRRVVRARRGERDDEG